MGDTCASCRPGCERRACATAIPSYGERAQRGHGGGVRREHTQHHQQQTAAAARARTRQPTTNNTHAQALHLQGTHPQGRTDYDQYQIETDHTRGSEWVVVLRRVREHASCNRHLLSCPLCQSVCAQHAQITPHALSGGTRSGAVPRRTETRLLPDPSWLAHARRYQW